MLTPTHSSALSGALPPTAPSAPDRERSTDGFALVLALLAAGPPASTAERAGAAARQPVGGELEVGARAIPAGTGGAIGTLAMPVEAGSRAGAPEAGGLARAPSSDDPAVPAAAQDAANGGPGRPGPVGFEAGRPIDPGERRAGAVERPGAPTEAARPRSSVGSSIAPEAAGDLPVAAPAVRIGPERTSSPSGSSEPARIETGLGGVGTAVADVSSEPRAAQLRGASAGPHSWVDEPSGCPRGPSAGGAIQARASPFEVGSRAIELETGAPPAPRSPHDAALPASGDVTASGGPVRPHRMGFEAGRPIDPGERRAGAVERPGAPTEAVRPRSSVGSSSTFATMGDPPAAGAPEAIGSTDVSGGLGAIPITASGRTVDVRARTAGSVAPAPLAEAPAGSARTGGLVPGSSPTADPSAVDPRAGGLAASHRGAEVGPSLAIDLAWAADRPDPPTDAPHEEPVAFAGARAEAATVVDHYGPRTPLAGSAASGSRSRPVAAGGVGHAPAALREHAGDLGEPRHEASSAPGGAFDAAAAGVMLPSGDERPSGPFAGAVPAASLAAGSPVARPPVIQLAAELAQRYGVAVRGLRLQLEPAELGGVEITLTHEGRRKARALVLVERPETLDLLQREQRTLERILAASGLELEAGGLELGLRQEAQGRRHQDEPEPASRPPEPRMAGPRPLPSRLVDLRLLDLVV